MNAFMAFRDALVEIASALDDFSSTYYDENLVLNLFFLYNRFEVGHASHSFVYSIITLCIHQEEIAKISLNGGMFIIHHRGSCAKLYYNRPASQSTPENLAKQMQKVLEDLLIDAIISMTRALKTFTNKGKAVSIRSRIEDGYYKEII